VAWAPEWLSTTAYQPGEITSRDGINYLNGPSVNSNRVPGTANSGWTRLAPATPANSWASPAAPVMAMAAAPLPAARPLSDLHAKIRRLTIAQLGSRTASRFRPRNEAAVAEVIYQRLASLICHIELDPKSTIPAKWYLINLRELPISPAERQFLAPLVERLQRNVDEIEDRYGVVDHTWFDKLVQRYNGQSRDDILFGPPPSNLTNGFRNPRFTTELDYYIQAHMWRQWDY